MPFVLIHTYSRFININLLFALDGSTYRKLYERVSDHRLSSVVGRQITNISVDECATYCIRETDFECKSFDFDNTRRACLLFSVSTDDPDVNLIASSGKDHYKSRSWHFYVLTIQTPCYYKIKIAFQLLILNYSIGYQITC